MPRIVTRKPNEAKERAISVRKRPGITRAVAHQFPYGLHRGIHGQAHCQDRLILLLRLISKHSLPRPAANEEPESLVRLKRFRQLANRNFDRNRAAGAASMKV
ncbi:hypothetical protein LDO11_15400 [Luteimonas sp. MHLX1A]|nr:hypothetical protein [Luteimonas sp. MHLX1A]